MFKKMQEMVSYFWMNSSMTAKVLLAILCLLFVINFWYAGATGMWFFNPFSLATWQGAYLKARFVYGAIVAAVGLTFAMLVEEVINN